ncbi:MAG TPA: nuclear transport factor 2 family protein [Candidatus Binatia bacterium]|nr:nuclear transport factor 2 family protein [Candidatus Binatia bacterium]
MDILQRFMAYANDFERTLRDDDWSRLAQYFAEDAVYEVKADRFGCRLVGRRAIFAGIKKSLDGFDRKFTGRGIELTSGPEVTGDEIRMSWKVTYTKDGTPPFVLRGSSIARYAGGEIAYLSDAYDPSVGQELGAWTERTGVAVDPAYT